MRGSSADPQAPVTPLARLRAVGDAGSELRALDAVAAVVLSLATLRGLWIGAVREAFSLAGLAAGVFAVGRWREAGAAWLESAGASGAAAQILAVPALFLAALLAVALVGRVARRGVRGAGLGLADRLAGAALGAAEGAVVVTVLVLGLAALLGREDAALAGTRTLASLEWTERALASAAPADVATGPPSDRARE
jgi:uncharacterized membrane protein required for colicin V production